MKLPCLAENPAIPGRRSCGDKTAPPRFETAFEGYQAYCMARANFPEMAEIRYNTYQDHTAIHGNL